MRTQERVISLRRLASKLGEILMSGDRPMVVTRDGIPVAFFIPARVWKAQEDSELSRQLVQLVLDRAGLPREEVQKSIEAVQPRKRRLLKMALADGHGAGRP
ncbi:MAG: hypothetical protein ABN502_14505 [Gammaproteobacteria bacterium]|uniref:hypothetical protein n=1 Tax=Gammaproteobacteria TaxID=1236 RepID=UPI0011269DCA|nr:hypothetical protein [Pseudomonas sp. Hp2]